MRKKTFIPVDTWRWLGVLFHGVLTMVMQQSMTWRKLPWFLVSVAYLAIMAVTVRLQPFLKKEPLWWSKQVDDIRRYSGVLLFPMALSFTPRWWNYVLMAALIKGSERVEKPPVNFYFVVFTMIWVLKRLIWGFAPWWGMLYFPLGLVHFQLCASIEKVYGKSNATAMLVNIHQNAMVLHMLEALIIWYARCSQVFPYTPVHSPGLVGITVCLLWLLFMRVMTRPFVPKGVGYRSTTLKRHEKVHVPATRSTQRCTWCLSRMTLPDMESR